MHPIVLQDEIAQRIVAVGENLLAVEGGIETFHFFHRDVLALPDAGREGLQVVEELLDGGVERCALGLDVFAQGHFHTAAFDGHGHVEAVGRILAVLQMDESDVGHGSRVRPFERQTAVGQDERIQTLTRLQAQIAVVVFGKLRDHRHFAVRLHRSVLPARSSQQEHQQEGGEEKEKSFVHR